MSSNIHKQFHLSWRKTTDILCVYFSPLCSYNKSCVTLVPELNNSFLNFSPIWNQRVNESTDIVDESLTGPSLQSGTKLGLFSYLFDRWIKQICLIRYSCCALRMVLVLTEILYIFLLFQTRHESGLCTILSLHFPLRFHCSRTVLFHQRKMLSLSKVRTENNKVIRTIRLCFNLRLYFYEHWLL